MFPRCSRLYRLIGLCLCLCILIMILNTHSDLAGHKRLPFLPDYSLRQLHYTQVGPPSRPSWTNRNATTSPPPTSAPEPIVNPHDFYYIYNPSDMCNITGLKYVIYVHSAPNNYKKRQMVRQTWGSNVVLKKYNMRLVFVMGVVKDRRINEAIVLENGRYGDLVVEDFIDSYRNLTFKAIAGLKWVSTYCANAVYVIKTDDDILIDIHSFMDYMNSSTVKEYGTKRLIICNQWLRMKVIRDKKSKWYISKKEFAEDYFPPYCSGSVFVMSSDVPRNMYKASLHTEFFWVDDFYVTGLLAKKIKVGHQRLNDGYILNANVALDKLNGDNENKFKFFHVNKLTHIYKMWTVLKQRRLTSCANCSSLSPETIQPT